jgi:sirohydrochlorin ferrochelatase
MSGSRALVLAAHGSSGPGYAAVFDWVANRIVGNRPDLDVLVGYLDHCEPRLADLPTDGAIVVPMLLGSTFHLGVDIPTAAPNALVAEPIGPDPRLAAVVAHRLVEAGWTAGVPVTLAAAGDAGLSDAAAQLGEIIGVEVSPTLIGDGQSLLRDGCAVATYLLARGHLADVVAACGAPIISAPIGADPRLADVAMSRYDKARPLV